MWNRNKKMGIITSLVEYISQKERHYENKKSFSYDTWFVNGSIITCCLWE